MTRPSQFGPLPSRNVDGRTPLKAYRNGDHDAARSGKTVAVILGGLGVNRDLTRRAIEELPAQVTLSFAAHAEGLADWIVEARRDGHEVLIELPMESASFDPSRPGSAQTLRADASTDDNLRKLHRLLARAQGYAGVINYNGDQYLTRGDTAAALVSELHESGLAFFTDGSFDTPSLAPLAQSVGLPFKTAFGLIDPSPDRTVIEGKLDNLSEMAKNGDGPIGVGFAYPETLDTLKGWIATLSSDGLVLVPATATLP
ncbi:MAG: divergent polysaccharide deacetylase family protein [Litorimonas sp.]